MFRKFIALLLFSLSLSIVSYGWNKPGHMVTGAIAYAELKGKDPQALKTVLELLKKHYYYPEWEKVMNSENISESDRDLFLFMYAARWADDIRDDQAEHRGKWHYINYPYKPKNEPESVRIFPADNDNIEKAWDYNVPRLFVSDDASKTKALTWIFHLAGDAHQPLHATSLYTALFQRPGGDLGGNLIFIKAEEDKATINLHSFWDGAITRSDKVNAVRNIATELRAKYPRNRLQKANDLAMIKWIQESFTLAREAAYLNGNLKGGTKENGEVVPTDYSAKMKDMSEKRVLLAGYRLSAFLSKRF